MAIIIKTNASNNIEDSVVDVDPQSFFQRLIVFTQPEEIKDAFSYQLCIRPISFFDKKCLTNGTHKSGLKNALLDQLRLCVYMPDIFQDTHYVSDEESLWQRLPRTVGKTFDEMCQSSKRYLLNNYGTVENIAVVFDGRLLGSFYKGQ